MFSLFGAPLTSLFSIWIASKSVIGDGSARMWTTGPFFLLCLLRIRAPPPKLNVLILGQDSARDLPSSIPPSRSSQHCVGDGKPSSFVSFFFRVSFSQSNQISRSFQASYNRVNGSWATQNSKTLNGILKGERESLPLSLSLVFFDR